MKKFLFMVAVGILTAAMIRCTPEMDAPATVAVTGITINPTGGVSIEAGQTIIFSANITPTNATNKNVAWSSLNTDIATVDIQTGVVTGVSAGIATIRATAADGSGITTNKSITITAPVFGQGNGTEGNPYIITTPEQLDAVRNNLSAHYKLGQDVDLASYLVSGGAGYIKWGIAGWEPIGNNLLTSFSGSFDGAGYIITSLWINRPSTDYVGLFGWMINGSVQNLGVEIATGGIIGGNNTGGVAGGVINSSGSISNSYAIGTINGNSFVGGVAGNIVNGASIINCYAIGAVSGVNLVGGIVGSVANSSSIISNCYASCTITGTGAGIGNSVGGVVGIVANSAKIVNCVALNPSVTGNVLVGRVAGNLSSSTPNNNWAHGITVTINGVLKTLDKGDDKVDGADIPSGAENTEEWWKVITNWNTTPPASAWKFGSNDENPWKWGTTISGSNYTLPILYWQTTAPAVTNVTGITINPSGVVPVEIGQTITFTANITPANATNKSVVWSSLNTGIATVDTQTGVVTGISTGTTTISAAAVDGSGVTTSQLITVIPFGTQGDGTLENPYIVYTSEQLDAVRNNLSAHYKLGMDIDLTNYLASGGTGYAKWGTAGWNPIGSIFSGRFDGAGFKITGLWINRPSTNYVGLFRSVRSDESKVQNLGVEIASTNGGIRGYDAVGGVAGIVTNNGSITNCYVVGQVRGNTGVGGVAGMVGELGSVIGGILTNCYTTINAWGSMGVGGVAGNAHYSSIANCYATGVVDGLRAGGVVGDALNSSIVNSYAVCEVSGGGYIGGIVGEIYNSSITNCIALNPSVIVAYSTSVGRVAGGIVSGGTLVNNWAQNSMIVIANGAPKTLDKGDDKIDGADCNTTPVESWWTTASPLGPEWNLSGTTVNPWKWSNALSRPVLYWQE